MYPPVEAILDQLQYLLEELRMLRPVIRQVPAPILEARPMQGTRSIKETFGHLIAAEEGYFQPAFRALSQGHPLPTYEEAVEGAPEPWNTLSIATLLDRLMEARETTLDLLEGLPPSIWTRREPSGTSLQILAYELTQHDARYLREIGERLRESHLTLRTTSHPL